MNSLFCCFFLEKSTKCSQNPGLVNEFSATPRGHLNWTGPIANSSKRCLGLSAVPKRGRSKRGRTQKHMQAKERKRAPTQVHKRAQKSANPKLGRQKVGYGTVVDGFAKFQALNFGEFQGQKFLRASPSNQQNKGFYWKFQALKSKFQGLKFGDSIHHRSIPHLLPPNKCPKIRAPIKIKSAFPPPPKPKVPPPPKTQNTPSKKDEEFYGHGFSCRKNIFQVSIKLAQPFPAPELRTRILRTRGFFWLRAQRLKKNFKILKFSSEIENFKRATHHTPYFFGGEFWRSGLKFSIEIEILQPCGLFLIILLPFVPLLPSLSHDGATPGSPFLTHAAPRHDYHGVAPALEWNFAAEIEHFKRDWFFSIFGALRDCKSAKERFRVKLLTSLIKVARLQSEFCTKDFFRATNFLTKNAPKFSPKFLSLCSVGQKKIPGKFPPNFPPNCPNFPAKNQKKFTDELLQERREKVWNNHVSASPRK